jgi:hypothetical protein
MLGTPLTVVPALGALEDLRIAAGQSQPRGPKVEARTWVWDMQLADRVLPATLLKFSAERPRLVLLVLHSTQVSTL